MEGNIDNVGSISIVPTNVATPIVSNEGIESIDPSIASEKDKEKDKTTVDVELTPSQSKRRKITSEVWNDFNRVVNGDKTVTASCKHCGRIFNGSSAMGTSHLNTHRKTCSRRTQKDVGQQLISMSKSSKESTPKLANFKFDSVTTRKDFARLIAKHSLPFNIAELSNKKKVSLDVPTRWNSTYEMLHNYLETLPTEDEWGKCKKIEKLKMSGVSAKKIKQCLKVFYDATKHVSGTKYPTANFYFKSVDDGCLRSMACTMRLKFDKYWRDTNLFMALGVVLDPRYKIQLVEYALQMIYEDDCEYYVRKIKKMIKYSNSGGVVGDESESIGARGKDSDEHSTNDKSIFGNKQFFKFIQERTGGLTLWMHDLLDPSDSIKCCEILMLLE
ncbi:hypothetical protein NE237_026661 [Protea cynaroides]|uniref:BED-type domain-containing protein n=1 Tax=Protea cynaroides TaxID=273540 RepID=A0A9Q0H5C3_9MAGN|nr:hypothetical protein NE237_026661 [Protea cynaroides]